MYILDKLNTYIFITIVTNIFIQLKISFNEDIVYQNSWVMMTVAHLEDQTSEPMLPTAPRSLLFQKEIFVKSWSDCHIVKFCPYCFSFLFLSIKDTSKIKFFTFQNIFMQCQHFQINIFFKLGETIPL